MHSQAGCRGCGDGGSFEREIEKVSSCTHMSANALVLSLNFVVVGVNVTGTLTSCTVSFVLRSTTQKPLQQLTCQGTNHSIRCATLIRNALDKNGE